MTALRLFLLLGFLALSSRAGAILCGDVNGDGVVNITDAFIIAQFDVGIRTCALPGQEFTHPEVCDTLNDNTCNIGDALKPAQCDVGLIPCGFSCTTHFNVCSTTTTTTTTTTGTGPTTTSTTTTTVTTTTVTTSTTTTTTITTTTTGSPTTSTTSPGSPGTVHWVTRYGGGGVENGLAIAADPSGNLLLGGYFSNGADLGQGPITTIGTNDGFVGKYTSTGTATWIRPFGAPSQATRTSGVAADALGNVFAVGNFSGTVNFGCASPVTSAGLSDIFVVKYSPTNVCQWVVRFGGVNDDTGNGVAVDPNGNVFATGTFSGTVNFGNGNLVPFSGGRNAFIIKINTSTHATIWSMRLGSGGESFGNGVAADPGGNAWVVGSAIGPVLFNGVTYPTAGGTDIFIAKYGAGAGAETWFKNPGSSGNDTGTAIAVDTDGNASITGQFTGTVDFGGGGLTATNTDPFVAKYGNTGTFVWAKQGSSPSFDGGTGIAVDPTTKDVVVTGIFGNTITWGGATLTTFGGTDIFLAKLAAATGAQVWAHRYGSTGNDEGHAVTIDTSQNVLATGFFTGTATFDTTTRVSAGSTDIFLVNVYP